MCVLEERGVNIYTKSVIHSQLFVLLRLLLSRLPDWNATAIAFDQHHRTVIVVVVGIVIDLRLVIYRHEQLHTAFQHSFNFFLVLCQLCRICLISTSENENKNEIQIRKATKANFINSTCSQINAIPLATHHQKQFFLCSIHSFSANKSVKQKNRKTLK